MKAILFAALFFSSSVALAQNPTPELDTTQIPVEQGDPALKTFSPDTYLKDFKRIMPDELPAPVRTTLDAGTQYEGWQRAPIYKNRKGDRFVLEIQSGDRTERFQFDAEGKPVSFDE